MKPVLARIALGLACLAPPAVAAGQTVDHPSYTSWARHPVGTAVTHRTVITRAGQRNSTVSRTELISRDDRKVVVREVKTTDVTGQEVTHAPQDFTINRAFFLLPGVKPEDVGKPTNALAQGEETLELAGRSIKTVWFDTRGKTEVGTAEARTWMSDEIPGRLVKARTENPESKRLVVQELTEIETPK